ncbi:MAG TPA: hypothetical protein VHJ20_06120 [Polyangia bacterium]|nr:hypothetical protein [Polyangia bacterium]
MNRRWLALLLVGLAACHSRPLAPTDGGGTDGARDAGDAASTGAGADAASDAATLVDANADAGTGCQVGSFPLQSVSCSTGACGAVCANACVDLQNDPSHCGSCDGSCPSTSACVAGKCGPEVRTIVPAAPGCLGLRLAADSQWLYVADVGHRTLSAFAPNGTSTVLASAANFALLYPDFTADGTTGARGPAPIVVNNGIVYWIGAATPATASADPSTGPLIGGLGTMIFSTTLSGAVRAVLPPAWKPQDFIRAIASSSDGATLFFADGKNFYSVPTEGTVEHAVLLGESGAHGWSETASSLVADLDHLYFPVASDEWVESFDFTQTCTPAADAIAPIAPGCANWIVGSHAGTVLDNVQVFGGYVYWADQAGVSRAPTANLMRRGDTGGADFSGWWSDDAPTGFVALQDSAGVRAFLTTEAGTIAETVGDPNGSATAIVNATRPIARGQLGASSITTDGRTVFWTTPNCDVLGVTAPAD